MRTRYTQVIASTLVVCGCVVGASIASALECTTTITVDADDTLTLSADYVADGSVSNSPCFELENNATLDLNGHTISRTNPINTASAAIQCLSSSTTVTDSASLANKGAITGESWSVGILDCETVDGVVIEGGGGSIITGIKTSSTRVAKSILNNVVNDTTTGLELVFQDSNSIMANNVVRPTNAALTVVGSTASGSGPIVEDNVFTEYGIGIFKSGNDKIRIRNNLLMRRDTEFVDGDCLDIVATGSTVSGNVCDCADQCVPDVPYSLPWF